MATKKIKAIELILDWNLWPRHSANGLDKTNIARMRESLRSGFPLPPVIVNKADMRVIDGFHRVTAVLNVYGDDAEIEADLREYDTEAAMFLAAGVANMHHGLTMNGKDRAHFILRCRKYKYPWETIAEALHMDKSKMKEFVEKRSARTQSGEVIAIPGGCENLSQAAGVVLTKEQECHVTRRPGGAIEMYIAMLLNALRADAVELSESNIARLGELRELLGVILDRVA